MAKAFSELSREEVLAELGIGGPASFGESFQRGLLNLVPAYGETVTGLATIAEDKLGIELDPVKEYGEEVSEEKNKLKEKIWKSDE